MPAAGAGWVFVCVWWWWWLVVGGGGGGRGGKRGTQLGQKEEGTQRSQLVVTLVD